MSTAATGIQLVGYVFLAAGYVLVAIALLLELLSKMKGQ